MDSILQYVNNIMAFLTNPIWKYLLYGIIFMLIAGIGMMLLSKFIGDYQDFQQLPIPGMYVGIGGLYIVISILYFFPCYYLLQFANKTKEGLKILQFKNRNK